jgi:hypothetical protein
MSEGVPGRRSPAAAAALASLNAIPAGPQSNSLSPIVPRSPSLRPLATSPPLSPRLQQSVAGAHHSRSPSFSATLNVVDLLATTQQNGEKPPAREWTKITLAELVEGQQLHFIDGDTPVEEACQVIHPELLGLFGM